MLDLCDDLTVYGRDQAEGADKDVGVVTWIKPVSHATLMWLPASAPARATSARGATARQAREPGN